MSFPDRFGRYLVRDVLGRGAMGTVYRAVDPRLDREVAIKVVTLSGETDEDVIENQARFERECRLVATLHHPHIVSVYDVGSEGETSYLAMELVEGQSLGQRLSEGEPLSYAEIVHLGLDIASALDHAHAKDIVHRDLKPANILLDLESRAKLTDFGIARTADSDMTRTGIVLGTPWTMSPEQAVGWPLTGRSDQFSLAVILYQLLTGHRPFQAESTHAILFRVVHDPPPDPTILNPALPPSVGETLLRAMSKEPQERFESCSELAAALAAALEGDPELQGQAPEPSQSVPLSPLGGTRSTVGQNSPTVALREAAIRRQKRHRRRRGLALAALAVVALLAAGVWVARRGMETEYLPVAGRAEAAGPREQAFGIAILSEPAGIEIWADGADQELRTPATLELLGAPGDARVVELRRDGRVLAGTRLVLGPGLPEEWSPALSTADEVPAGFLRVESRPPGAWLAVENRAASHPTPVVVSEPSRGAALRLAAPGHRSLVWRYDSEALSEGERAARTVMLTLTEAPFPGEVDEAVDTVRAGGSIESPRLLFSPPVPKTREGGTVILKIVVDPHGEVASTEILRGASPTLDRRALDLVQLRRYEPPTHDGKPVNVELTATVRFGG